MIKSQAFLSEWLRRNVHGTVHTFLGEVVGRSQVPPGLSHFTTSHALTLSRLD